MIQSMTGYGDAACTREGLAFELEVRSVNNRYFKANIKLSDNIQTFEPDIEKLLRARIGRGSVNYQLKIKSSDNPVPFEINVPALRSYLDQLQSLVADGSVESVQMAPLLALPGVCIPREIEQETRDQMFEVVKELTDIAVGKLIAMRSEEGSALRKDLLHHAAELRKIADDTGQLAPAVVTSYQKRLKTRIEQLLADGPITVENDDFLREVAIFAERCDISEELIRLRSHLDQLEGLCDSDEFVGRKLDFLSQEMLREVNTIGSKANDAGIARNVVDMKGLIDRIKEQVQNVQ